MNQIKKDYDVLFQNMAQGAFFQDKSGAFIDVNFAALKMLGLTREHLLERTSQYPDWHVIKEDGSHLLPEDYPSSIALNSGKEARDYIAGIYNPLSKTFIWVNINAIPMFREGEEEPYQVFVTLHDITEKKRIDEALQKSNQDLRIAQLIARVGNWTLDPEVGIPTWSDEIYRIYERDPELGPFSSADYKNILKGEWFEIFNSAIQSAIGEGQPYDIELKLDFPTGKVKWVRAICEPEKIPGSNRYYLRGTVQDITDRKQVEDALRKSEERHKLFYNPSFGGSIILDNKVILDCSSGIINITGYSNNELIGMDGLLLIAPDWRDFVMDKIKSGFDEPYEAESIRKDGTIFPARLHATTINYHGKEARVVEFRDITEIRKKEKETQAAREFLNKVIDFSMFGMCISDKEGTIIQVNRSLCESLNRPEDKIVGKYNFFKDDNLKTQGVMPKVTSVFEKYQPARFTILWQAASAGVNDWRSARDMYIDVYMFPVMDTQGDLKNVVCQWLDITEPKEAEKILNQKHEMLKNTEAMAHIGSWEWDVQSDRAYWSEELFRIFGRNPAEGAPSFAEQSELYGNGDMHRLRNAVENCIKQGAPYEIELRAIRTDGEVRHCISRGKPQYDENGEVSLISGSFQDITERKQAEKALQESNAKYECLIQSVGEGFLKADKQGYITKANIPIAEMCGYKSPEEMLGINMTKLYANPIDRDSMLESINKTGVAKNFELKINKKDGTSFWSLNNISNTINDEGEIIGTHGLILDITAKKEVEQALKASEERFRTLVNESPYPTVVMDTADEKILYWSKSAQDKFGHDPKTVAEWYTLAYPDPHYRQKVIDRWKTSLEQVHHSKTAVNTGNYQIVCRDGSVKICEICAQFIHDRLIVTFNDITELKKVESAKDHLIDELMEALDKVKKLEGILPICSYCKQIRDDQGAWAQLEEYLSKHSEAMFSHGVCPTCYDKKMSEIKNLSRQRPDS